jgi:hypothetical protein
VRYLPLLLVLPMCGASCGDQAGPTQNTYEHILQTRQEWLAQGLPDLNAGCKNYMIRMHVTYLSQVQLQAACGVGEELYGCLQGNDILVADTVNGTVRADYVIEHELRHWFGGCTPLGPDGGHTSPVLWYPYRGWDLREDVP